MYDEDDILYTSVPYYMICQETNKNKGDDK